MRKKISEQGEEAAGVFLLLLMCLLAFVNVLTRYFIRYSFNLAIGQITPLPVAVNLYVIANIAGLSLEDISKSVLPFVAIMAAALLVILFFRPCPPFFRHFSGSNKAARPISQGK